MAQGSNKIRNVLANTLIIFVSITGFLLFLETVGRLVSSTVDLFPLENLVSRRINMLGNAYPSAYHPDLGYIPTPGARIAHDPWGKSLTILEHGIRSNGSYGTRLDDRGSVILAVGDSFTFGAQVSNSDTWPAQLAALVNEKVINGGVFGYGLDQTVLRAEELATFFSVRIVLVGFIPDDINRTGYSIRTGVAKPYFVVEHGRLVRRNRPVPQIRPVKVEIGPLRSILGYSYLMSWIMGRLGLTEWWFVGQWESRKVHSQEEQVACLLTRRLRDLGLKTGARIIMVAQYWRPIVLREREVLDAMARSRHLLDCAKSIGLEVLDLYEPLQKTYDSDAELYDSYFDNHMTAAGNRFVAEQIASYLAGH